MRGGMLACCCQRRHEGHGLPRTRAGGGGIARRASPGFQAAAPPACFGSLPCDMLHALLLLILLEAAEGTGRAALPQPAALRRAQDGGNSTGWLPVVLWHGKSPPCRPHSPPPTPPPSSSPPPHRPPPQMHPTPTTPPPPAGMGDSCCSPHSIGAVKAAIEAELPGVFVHSIATGPGALDVWSSYFGNLNDQARGCRGAGPRSSWPGCGLGADDGACCGSHSHVCAAATDAASPPPHVHRAQVARVCDELLGMEQLRNGYVAVGFSQVRASCGWLHF